MNKVSTYVFAMALAMFSMSTAMAGGEGIDIIVEHADINQSQEGYNNVQDLAVALVDSGFKGKASVFVSGHINQDQKGYNNDQTARIATICDCADDKKPMPH